jgi:ABC-2 type transport system ATP-binding protein
LDRIRLTINAASDTVLGSWQAIDGVQQISAEDSSIALMVDDSNAVLPRLFEAAAQADLRITSVEVQEPNLEAVFLHLTGRALRD